MINIKIITIYNFFFIIFLLFNYFFNFCKFFFLKHSSVYKQFTSKFYTINFIKFNDLIVVILLSIFSLFTLKIKFCLINYFYYYWIIFIFCIIVLIILIFNFYKLNIKFIYLNLILLIIFSMLIFTIKCFLSYFILIELYTILYFFFFIEKSNKSNNIELVKLKNLIIFMLWNNFLTSIFYNLGLLFCIYNYGSISFFELKNFNLSNFIYLFIVSLAWKLSIPSFHFFKIEIYKNLNPIISILFSIFSILINVLIFYTFILNSIVITNIINYKIVNLILFTTSYLIMINLKIINIQQFLAFSSILTTNFLIIIFIL